MEKLTAPASKEQPRWLLKKGSDTPVRVTDAGEYLSMTSGLGYHDVTDEVQHALNEEQAPAEAAPASTPGTTAAQAVAQSGSSATGRQGGSSRQGATSASPATSTGTEGNA